MRLYVGSLHFNVSENDLRPVFEAFGPIEGIELHKDPATGQSRGFGFVSYKLEADGRQALATLNGVEIAGRPVRHSSCFVSCMVVVVVVLIACVVVMVGGGAQMKVGVVDAKPAAVSGVGFGSFGGGAGGGGGGAGVADNQPVGRLDELDDGERGGLALTAQSRASLMAKLSRSGEAVRLTHTQIDRLPYSDANRSAFYVCVLCCVVYVLCSRIRWVISRTAQLQSVQPLALSLALSLALALLHRRRLRRRRV